LRLSRPLKADLGTFRPSAEDPRDRRIAKKPSKLQNNLSRLDDVNLLLGQPGKVSLSSIGKSTAETLPVATVRKFAADWLRTKEPEVTAGTLAFYKKSIAKFLEFLGTAADLDLASITRTTVLEFRNHLAKRSSPVEDSPVNGGFPGVKSRFSARCRTRRDSREAQ
jgi:hypothetical protein